MPQTLPVSHPLIIRQVAACGKATAISNYSSAAAQLAFICMYIGFFAATWGPAAWVVTGEIFPLKVRAKGLSLTTAVSHCLVRYAGLGLILNVGKLVFQLAFGFHYSVLGQLIEPHPVKW